MPAHPTTTVRLAVACSDSSVPHVKPAIHVTTHQDNAPAGGSAACSLQLAGRRVPHTHVLSLAAGTEPYTAGCGPWDAADTGPVIEREQQLYCCSAGRIGALVCQRSMHQGRLLLGPSKQARSKLLQKTPCTPAGAWRCCVCVSGLILLRLSLSQ